MEKDIFQIIEAKLSTFSKSKQQIGSYILDNPNEAAFQTAAQIGKAVRISESTVVRFASDLGYKGFPPFQRALQQVLKERLQSSPGHQTEQASEDHSDPYFQELENAIRSLRKRMDPQLRDSVETAVETLSHCDTLYLMGTPSAEPLLPLCKYMAEKVIDRVVLLFPYHQDRLLQDLSRMKAGDHVLLIGIGELSGLMKFMLQQCLHNGVKVLLLLDHTLDKDTSEYAPIIQLTSQTSGEIGDYTECVALLQTIFRHLQTKNTAQIEARNNKLEDIKNAYYSYELYSM